MRVLQINAVSRIRSTGRLSAEIADYLNANGHDGYMAYSAGVPYSKGYKIGTKAEIKLHGFLSRLTGLQAYYSKRGTKNLLRYLDTVKPDAVHLENLHANYINLRMLLSYLAKNDIPTVLTLWDCWFFTGKCCHFTVDGCYKWKKECGNCPRLKKDNISWFFDRTNKMRRDKQALFAKIPRLAVVGVSDWITAAAKQSLLADAKRIVRIYNWIDMEVFRPAYTLELGKKLNPENKFIVLGIASIWTRAKGFDGFIELARQLPANMQIIMVGKIGEEAGLPNNIIHIAETHDVNEMAGLYSLADAFVHLSVEETFGLVTAEALACGTPAVVIDSTANPELIGEGCGYVVGGDDIHGVVACLLQIMENGKASYSEKCVAYARANFLKDERIADYINVYREIIQ